VAAFSIDVVSVFCRDHEALAAFYMSVMGFEEVAAVRSPIFIGLDAGGATLGFHHDDAYDLLDLADRRSPTGTSVHITFAVGSDEEVEAAVDVISTAGGSILKPPYDSYYDARQIVAADPEGNVFRVTHQR
jgi:catechol 2,3-dioxygenase-like lactoylglutathione lyase family enzyme